MIHKRIKQSHHYFREESGFITILAITLIILLLGIVSYVYFSKSSQSNIVNQPNQKKLSEYVGDADSYLFEVKPNVILNVPTVEGKIAFVKDNNIWIAKNGKAYALTNDATNRISPLFQSYIQYHHPIWSPDGSVLALLQDFSYYDKNKIHFADENHITASGNDIDKKHAPFWYKDHSFFTFTTYPVPKNDTFTGLSVSYTLKSDLSAWEEPPYISFKDIDLGESQGCGGGGFSAWVSNLSQNELGGGGNGERSTLFYIESRNELVYSIGCENERVLTLKDGTSISKPFGQGYTYDITKAPGNQTVPRELMLSHHQDVILGTTGSNVALFDLDGNLKQLLSKDTKAYGPVFSNSDKFIYYAGNLGGNPKLIKVDQKGTNTQMLYQHPTLGAISNITTSPDDSKILFTVITQSATDNSAGFDAGTATEDLYTINSDGSDLKLFMKDASQASWSK